MISGWLMQYRCGKGFYVFIPGKKMVVLNIHTYRCQCIAPAYLPATATVANFKRTDRFVDLECDVATETTSPDLRGIVFR